MCSKTDCSETTYTFFAQLVAIFVSKFSVAMLCDLEFFISSEIIVWKLLAVETDSTIEERMNSVCWVTYVA